MKYLVVSDIHGSYSGAVKMEEAYALHHADHILCLGDILYHGPRNDLPEDYAPKKVIPLMSSHEKDLIAVRGNCDTEVDQMVLSFPLLSDYMIIPLEKNRVFLTHGHIYNTEKMPPLRENDLFLSGHTHIPAAEKRDDVIFCNPGSISLPKQNHPRTYGILEDHSFTVYTIEHKKYMEVTF